MKAIHYERIIALIPFLFIYNFSLSQKSLNKSIEQAIDSLVINPKYSYQSLLDLSKNEKIKDSLKAKVYLNLGSYFNNVGVSDSSVYYTKKAMFFLKDDKQLAEAYRILGSSYRIMGKVDSAIKMLYKSLEISESINYRDMISKAKSDLGILHAYQKDFDKSLKFFEESIDIADNKRAVYGNYVNIGNIYFFKKDLERALSYYMDAYALVDLKKDPKVSATLALNIGSILQKKSKPKQAIIYYDRCKNIAETHNLWQNRLVAISHRARALKDLEDNDQAIETYLSVLSTAKKLKNIQIQKEAYQNLAELYSRVENYKQANRWLHSFYHLKDSMNTLKWKREVLDLEIKYEADQKQKQITLLKTRAKNRELELQNQQKIHQKAFLSQALESEKKTNEILSLKNANQYKKNKILILKKEQLFKNEEIKRQKLIRESFIIGFIVILIPISILFFILKQKLKLKNLFDAQKNELHDEKIKFFIKEQELKVVNACALAQNQERKRIARELHDNIGGGLAIVKMMLSNVSTQIHQKAYNTFIECLDNMYQQIREISRDLTSKEICQTLFTDYINEYIDTIRKVSKPIIVFIPHPEEEVNSIENTKKIEIFRIIQELLTNALKHANAQAIEICLNTYKDVIEIIFEDDGVGFDQNGKSQGMGLENISERLVILNASMDIDSMINRGVAIRIRIPILNA